jgi:hypothetical protein
MLIRRTFAFMCALLLSDAATAQPLLAHGALDWLPIGVLVEPVGDAMRINGLSTEVVRLRGAVSVDELREAFLAQDARPVRNTIPPVEQIDGWELLARPDGRGFQTLQLRSDARGSVEAVFSRTDLGNARKDSRVPPLRLPADARITSIVESADDGKRATQFVAWSSLSVERARGQICQRAIADGWNVPDCESPQVSLSRGNRSVSMSVAAATLPFSHRAAQPSVIVLNVVEQSP